MLEAIKDELLDYLECVGEPEDVDRLTEDEASWATMAENILRSDYLWDILHEMCYNELERYGFIKEGGDE